MIEYSDKRLGERRDNDGCVKRLHVIFYGFNYIVNCSTVHSAEE